MNMKVNTSDSNEFYFASGYVCMSTAYTKTYGQALSTVLVNIFIRSVVVVDREGIHEFD